MSRRLRALCLDVGGTLLHPAEPVGDAYARVAARHGLRRDPERVGRAFRQAFRELRAQRHGAAYPGDGRPFWREVVARALDSRRPALFEDLYAWYGQPQAWTVAPGALDALATLRARGLRLALVSDWDSRLRPLLKALDLLARVDHAAISCEVGAEKPDPRLFLAALEALGVPPAEAAHLGDDPLLDQAGARAVGMQGWLWGHEVRAFEEVAARPELIGEPELSG